MASGGTFRLTFLTLDNNSLDIPVSPQPHSFPELTPELLRFIDKLCTIQNKTGQHLSVMFGGGANIQEVDKLMSIIEQGKVNRNPEWASIKPEKKTLEALLDIQQQGRLTRLGIAKDESYVELLGCKIQLGRIVKWLSGTIEMPIVELEKATATLTPNERLPLKFVDVEIVEIFPDWFIREAQQLSQLLIKEFEVEAVYPFGSLVWGQVWTIETDIDLAVSGLPAERYLEAVSYLERESKFSIDLVDLSKVSDHLRQRILTEGKILYEREPVAAFG